MKFLARRSRVALAATVVLAVAAGCSAPTSRRTASLERAFLAPSVSERDTQFAIAGLRAPVRLTLDRWGIVHVLAENRDDLYFAWGFVHARDRGWQLEYLRRAGRGRMWEWFGNRALRADGGAQLFELESRAARLWERDRQDPETARAIESYVRGINACIARCRDGTLPWPPEFESLRRYPSDWIPADLYLTILAQAFVLDFDVPELDEAEAVARDGAEAFRARERFEGEQQYFTIPDSAAARIYGAAIAARPPGDAPVIARQGAIGATRAATLARLARDARQRLGGWFEPVQDPEQRASNVFAVGAARSASGRPMLANDPHLPLLAPGTLHAIHLSCPAESLDVIGAGTPGVPVILSGRTRRVAWGLTTLSADLVDVYADTLSADGRKVRAPDGSWVPVREEGYAMRYRALGVLDLPPFGQKRRYTPHGPVIAWEPKRRLALSVRWAGDDSLITLRRLIGIERSRDAREMADRARTLVKPAFNFVAADVGGQVVYQASGALPRRGFEPDPGPIPSDGRHEWQGEITGTGMPRWEPAPEGYVANGNNTPVGRAFPEPLPRYGWMQDRALRIAERLEADTEITLDDLRSIQTDVRSRAALRIVPLLLACADSINGRLTARQREALEILRGWNGEALRAEVAPTLYRSWYGAYLRRSGFEDTPGLGLAALDGRAPAELVRAGRGPERAAEAAVAALDTALVRLSAMLGDDMRLWTWERAHRARFRHDLAWFDSAFAPPTFGMDGDNHTPAVGRSNLPWSPHVTHGPAWRHLVDLAVPDSSWGIVTPGNSGRGPHARDLADRWADRAYVPLHLDWRRIETVRASEWLLTPQAGSR